MMPQAEGFTFSIPAKISLINTLKLGFEQGRIKFSNRNKALEQELRYYEYELSEETGNIKMHAPLGKFDDCVIALALAYQTCSVIGSVEVLGVTRKEYKREVKPIEKAATDSVYEYYPPIPSSWGNEIVVW
jgi:hypothetical protein